MQEKQEILSVAFGISWQFLAQQRVDSSAKASTLLSVGDVARLTFTIKLDGNWEKFSTSKQRPRYKASSATAAAGAVKRTRKTMHDA